MWMLRTSRLVSFFQKRFSRIQLQISRPQLYWTMTKKKYNQSHQTKRLKTGTNAIKFEGSNEEVLLFDVNELLAVHAVPETRDDDDKPRSPLPTYTPPERFTEIEVNILELSSSGDGLGISSTKDHVYVVPFALPGDLVKAKVVRYFAQDRYTLTDFMQVVVPSPQRDDHLIKCPYFSKCSGCQFQMLQYEKQLAHKKKIIEKAYRNFSTLIPELIPAIHDTIGSPLQYGYRTKLTPHFDGPPGSMSSRNRRGRINGPDRKGFDEVPPIGFMLKGMRKTIDIEDCPIGTNSVRLGIAKERKRVIEELAKYKKGATLLLRESTSRKQPSLESMADKNSTNDGQNEGAETNVSNDTEKHQPMEASVTESQTDRGQKSFQPYIEEKICITDSNAISTEFVDDFMFTNPAGAFFQNNNSILPLFTAYIRDHILPRKENGLKTIRYLIDAYCGSGLFTITLSSLFLSSMGIDIAAGSIESAKINAVQNRVSNASFMTADAAALFQEVTYPPDETVVIIDPPRKGCNDAFLQQLLSFGPKRVVYVSCNVHTQARDIGVLAEGNQGIRYEIESIRGFDFFPQTGHVEGVTILSRSSEEDR